MRILGKFLRMTWLFRTGSMSSNADRIAGFGTRRTWIAGREHWSWDDDDQLARAVDSRTLSGVAYTYRISVEEKALLEGLGTPYREYMQRTWRLIPFAF